MFINRSLDVNVGPKFINISNHDLIALLEKTCSENIIKFYYSKNKDRLVASVSFDNYKVVDDSLGGTIVPRLYVKNSNHGGECLVVGVGLYRQVCTNGLMMYFGDVHSNKIKHVQGPKLTSFLDVLPAMIEHQIKTIVSGQVFDEAYEASQVEVKNPINAIGNLPISNIVKDRAIAQIVNQTHRKEDNPYTAWGLYNLINELSRLRSRTEYNALNKDIGLLDHIVVLAA